MLWLIVTISAYFLAAVSALGDKYLLAGPPNPKSYSFYVGTLGILILVLIPFVGFSVPEINQIILSLIAGSIFIIALFCLYTGLENFEASRVVPAIGGILPLFTLGLIFLSVPGEKTLSFLEIIAFILLVLGSVLIALEIEKKPSLKCLKITTLAAFLFAISFVLSKLVYMAQPFWSGFILMRIGGFLTAFCFIFTKEVKNEIFQKQFTFQKKTGIIFFLNQAIGGGSFILQNWAIALVPLVFLPFINALEGTKYVFLLILTVLISLKFSQILKEKVSRKIILQKMIAILLIGGGLVLLAIK